MNKLNKDIVKVMEEFWKDAIMIPIFINNTNYKHIRCKNQFTKMCQLLQPLFELKFIPNNEIDELGTTFIDNILYITTIHNTIGMKYFDHTIELFTYYIDKCNKNELYEASGNILHWLKVIDKYKPISKWITIIKQTH